MPLVQTAGFLGSPVILTSRCLGEWTRFFHPRPSVFWMPASRKPPQAVLAVYPAPEVREGLSSQSSFGHRHQEPHAGFHRAGRIPNSCPSRGRSAKRATQQCLLHIRAAPVNRRAAACRPSLLQTHQSPLSREGRAGKRAPRRRPACIPPAGLSACIPPAGLWGPGSGPCRPHRGTRPPGRARQPCDGS